MERWSGLLRVPFNPEAGTLVRVAASLCLSPSKTFTTPSLNAIFFNGDRVEGTGNPIIEKLSDLQNIASILVSKLGNHANAWVIEAPQFSGPFAVYKEFIPTVNPWGDPTSYVPDGFPAASSLQLILSRFLQEAERVASSKGESPSLADAQTVPLCRTCPQTILLGFSKGGVVLNQLLTELASYNICDVQNGTEKGDDHFVNRIEDVEIDFGSIVPTSVRELFKSIVQCHYIDVGLNRIGAYPTDLSVINKISNFATTSGNSILFGIHGTPRQWSDPRRTWICKEKDTFVHLLNDEANSSSGKVRVYERLYFPDHNPSMKIQFEIIEHVNLGQGYV